MIIKSTSTAQLMYVYHRAEAQIKEVEKTTKTKTNSHHGNGDYRQHRAVIQVNDRLAISMPMRHNHIKSVCPFHKVFFVCTNTLTSKPIISSLLPVPFKSLINQSKSLEHNSLEALCSIIKMNARIIKQVELTGTCPLADAP